MVCDCLRALSPVLRVPDSVFEKEYSMNIDLERVEGNDEGPCTCGHGTVKVRYSARF